MSYVDLEVGHDAEESPETVYQLLVDGLPVKYVVIDPAPDGTEATFPVIRFFGDAKYLEQLIRRWLTIAGDVEEPPEIHTLTIEGHVEELKRLAGELGSAIRRGDQDAVEHLFDVMCQYVESEVPHHVSPVMLVRVSTLLPYFGEN